MTRFGPRRYKLQFDDRDPVFVNAHTPAEAVSLRPGGRASRLPHTITDLTALSTFGRLREYGLPLLRRTRGEGW